MKMTLDLLLFVAFMAASAYAGYSLRGHIHDIADAAVQKVKDVL